MMKEKNYLNKEEFVKVMRKKIEEQDGYVNQETATELLNIVLESIIDTVKKDKGISFIGFGKFEIRERAKRRGRNPRTGEEIEIPASRSVGFSAGKELKKAVPKLKIKK